jgi:antitoxin ParD1/3/4
MSTMNISLPETLRAFVQRRVKRGGYGTASEFVRELLRIEQARDELRTTLVASLESPAREVNAGFWAEKRSRAKKQSR